MRKGNPLASFNPTNLAHYEKENWVQGGLDPDSLLLAQEKAELEKGYSLLRDALAS